MLRSPYRVQEGKHYDDNRNARNVIERVTGAFAEINTDHKYIHEGIAFRAHIEVGEISGDTEFLFRAPAGKYVHYKNTTMQALGGSVKLQIIRGVEVTDSDAFDSSLPLLTEPANLSDVSDNNSLVEIAKNPTYTSGEVWRTEIAYGDSTNQFTSLIETKSFDNEELVMKPGGDYVFKLSRYGSDTPLVALSLFWYEEDSA